GMRIPAGTPYYMPLNANDPVGDCGGLVAVNIGSTAWKKVEKDDLIVKADRCVAVIPYFPATYYSKSDTLSAGSGYKQSKVVR
ncbi:hypothetical protein AB4084_40320, partial [Lysobacter sp. 2RAB21]